MYIPEWLIIGLLVGMLAPLWPLLLIAGLFILASGAVLVVVLGLALWVYSAFGFWAMCGVLEAGFFIGAIAWFNRPTTAGRLARQRSQQRHARLAG